jgi:pyruvate/2-oxoglutarate dehydrogenase complex dihydrolipoamide acyltransferase (E2) component
MSSGSILRIAASAAQKQGRRSVSWCRCSEGLLLQRVVAQTSSSSSSRGRTHLLPHVRFATTSTTALQHRPLNGGHRRVLYHALASNAFILNNEDESLRSVVAVAAAAAAAAAAVAGLIVLNSNDSAESNSSSCSIQSSLSSFSTSRVHCETAVAAASSSLSSVTEDEDEEPTTTRQQQSQQQQHPPRNVMLHRMRSVRARNLNEKYKVDWNQVLGEGAYGAVYPARLATTREKVALKKINRRYTNTSSFKTETDALLRIFDNGGHPNISGLRGMCNVILVF